MTKHVVRHDIKKHRTEVTMSCISQCSLQRKTARIPRESEKRTGYMQDRPACNINRKQDTLLLPITLSTVD